MSVKRIKVDGVAHQIDYNALENLPDRPKKVNIINYVVDTEKTDGRPVKTAAYAGGKIDSVEVFRYACPERIDIDDAAETHSSYIKDGRQMYARDGDFGYPEIDGTGQFNFRPVWNVPGYVVIPNVTDFDGKPHDDRDTIKGFDPLTETPTEITNPNYNPCYNNFKTQWNTGIPGLYRFTKVKKDINVELTAVEEASMPAHTITYKVKAPVDYPVENLPEIRIFRGADHCEKFMKYGPGATNPLPHPELDTGLISGNLLAYGEPEVVDEYNVWTILDKAYDDADGLPSADTTGDVAKVYFNISGTPAEGYAYTVAAKKVGTNYNKLNNPAVGKSYYTLTKVAGDVEVDIDVVVDVADVTLTFVNNTNYSVEDTVTKLVVTEPLTINGLQDYQFKVNHQLGDGGAHDAIITSVSIDGVEGTILSTSDLEGADAAVVWKPSNKKDECRIKKAYIPTAKGTEHNIIITLGTASVEEPEPEPTEPTPEEPTEEPVGE